MSTPEREPQAAGDDELDYGEALQETLQSLRNQEGGGVVTRWVVISEFMSDEGERGLDVMRGPGVESIPIWDVRGMLFEILHDPDIFNEEEDDD